MAFVNFKNSPCNNKITEKEANVGKWYDAVHWQDEYGENDSNSNNRFLYCLVSTDSGVHELRKCVSKRNITSQLETLQSSKILGLGIRDPLWALHKKRERINITNGYSKYTYEMKGQNLCRLTKSNARDNNEQDAVYWHSGFYTVICKNIIGSEDTYVQVTPKDINLVGEFSSLKLPNTKVLQIVPASWNRFMLFGTKISVIEVIPALDFQINVLESSVAPRLPLAVGGYLECNHLAIQCPYASKIKDTTVRIPLPVCLAEGGFSYTG